MEKRVMAISALLLLVMLILTAGALAEEPLTDEWQGISVTPMYYYYCNYPNYGIRVSCSEVPMVRLVENLQDIQLLHGDGSIACTGYRLIVMDETLNGTEGDRTTEFFDVVFQVDEKPGDAGLIIRFGDAGQPISVPDGDGNLERCFFRTESGSWAINFWNRMGKDQAEALSRLCADEMRGQDITLWLDDYYSNLEVSDFLELVDPASVRLITTVALGNRFDTGIITELTGMSFLKPSYPVLPNVKKLTLFKSSLFPYGSLTESFPALEELNLIIKISDPDENILSSDKRSQNVSGTLKRLNCTLNGRTGLPNDPDFLIWLIAQQTVTPDMTVNGEDSGTIHPEEGLDEEYLMKASRIRDDLRLKNFRSLLRGSNVKKGRIPSGSVVVTAFDESGDIVFSSTDTDPGYDLSGIPAERMAGRLSEASVVAVIYPVSKVTGRYTNGLDAVSTETRIALIDLQKEKVILDKSVVKRKPPSSITVSGARISRTSGEFEVQMGIDAAAQMLKSSKKK